MAPLDIGGLAPVSDDSPAGPNLELDPEFGALERAAQGKPEVQYGNTIEPAVPPDWKETAELAEALMQRTHDLRVMVHLAIARLNLDGLIGFAAVVHLIRQQLDDYWPEVHPQLDPEDDNDPMQRSNAVLRLQDPAWVLRVIRDLPLATTPRTGPVSWRQIAVLKGTVEAEPEKDKDKVTEASVLAAFRDCDHGRLERLRAAVDGLVADLPGIAAAFDRNAGPATGPDYTPLNKLVRDIQQDLKRYASAPAAAEEETAPPASSEDRDEATSPKASAAPGRGFASIIAITSLARREEALHALDLAAAYFRTQEPSSPAPMLIDRAKRLADMDFLSILKELAPDGVRQAETIAGVSSE